MKRIIVEIETTSRSCTAKIQHQTDRGRDFGISNNSSHFSNEGVELCSANSPALSLDTIYMRGDIREADGVTLDFTGRATLRTQFEQAVKKYNRMAMESLPYTWEILS